MRHRQRIALAGEVGHRGGLGEDYVDPFEVLKQREEEGPPEIRARLHSCQKLQVRALRNTLNFHRILSIAA